MNWSTLLRGTSTTKKTNDIDYLINRDSVLHTLSSRGIQIIIATVIFFLIWHIGERLLTEYLLKNPKFQERMTGRKRTLAQLGIVLFQYTILLFYLYNILALTGILVGTLLASVGLVSLALGVSAQDLVSDVITRMDILSEGECGIGDTVRIGNYTGTVLSLTLRNTRLKTTNGAVIYIPNRNIIVVENLSHGSYSDWNMDTSLSLSIENNLTEIDHAVDTVNAALEDKFEKQIKKGPQIIGIINQTGSSIIYQIHFRVITNSQSTIRSAYLSVCIKEFNRRGLKSSPMPTEQESSFAS